MRWIFLVGCFVIAMIVGAFLSAFLMPSGHGQVVLPASAQTSPLTYSTWPPLPQEVQDIIDELPDLKANLEEARQSIELIIKTTPKELEVAARHAEKAAELASEGKLDQAYAFATKAVHLEQKVILKHKDGAEVIDAYARAINHLAEAINKLVNAIKSLAG